MKKLFVTFLFFMVCFAGCSESVMPMCAVIKNQTPFGAPKTTLTVVYSEDKRVRQKFCDLFVKSDGTGCAFTFAPELGEKQKVCLEKADEWYSLTSLLGRTPTTFARVEGTTFVLWGENGTKLCFKVVGGDVKEGEEELENVFDVSKEVWVNL